MFEITRIEMLIIASIMATIVAVTSGSIGYMLGKRKGIVSDTQMVMASNSGAETTDRYDSYEYKVCIVLTIFDQAYGTVRIVRINCDAYNKEIHGDFIVLKFDKVGLVLVEDEDENRILAFDSNEEPRMLGYKVIELDI